jgi:hypothetical protein
MCNEDFKQKVDELVAKLKAGATDPILYEIIEHMVINDPEYLSSKVEDMNLELKLEPQSVSHKMMKEYLPERWELVRDNGRLLYSDKEIQKALILLIYNIGVEKSLDMLPTELIEEYLQKKDERSQG